jgi:hypothetical protein
LIAYVSDRVDPHDPPNTTQRSIPRCFRSLSMSSTRSQVVFSSRHEDGVLWPHPRCEKRTMRYTFGSKYWRSEGKKPPPGPPWRYTTGFPCCNQPVKGKGSDGGSDGSGEKVIRNMEWECAGQEISLRDCRPVRNAGYECRILLESQCRKHRRVQKAAL